ncbi:RNA polymerase sigma factor [Phenylobacterium sp.]|uniref:RNA polymerase sigma factor n=1 Tax=Phenylobacterium sp. TaxID=1871053 RepID=UPI00272F4C76|nr:sigma-70 family RNA polymerase sigma factor [Phenylobacterium sp.]MDP1618036.1 sigma-70 family RNA polymerase sigma factor [Phenylobacterium sp.]MDP1987447.1 sigma-70 family RNA polymerase sigma factor [Phenylobacterium sp.]
MSRAERHRLSSLHDVELATLAAAGDRQAFGELVRRHGSAVRGLLRRMGASASEADDLAQDAFISAFESISEFRGEGAFAAWVKKIAARACMRRMQRAKRLRDLTAAGADDPAPVAHPDPGGRMDLDEALKALTDGERLCVSLCYGAGLSHGEAAEALNLPLGTVKSHVKRGLDKLRARLAPEDQSVEGRRDNG